MNEIQSYNNLVNIIGNLLTKGRERAGKAINTILIQTYWEIGRYIVEFEQGGKEKAEYGSKLLDKLSKDLIRRMAKDLAVPIYS